ncbi:unnamed protein product [Acanthoscelides obtectus]|uniref:Uncharacterized protein n=1 Tax=Acanthoscelides obtectus TaxID=200917 RepID=A0A9P0L1F0_ACAOB|nr:unnamed protein product [Acanthoscelides obtectus]CAK1652940.1 hypothetical protein AOBTE_LOCUS17978 [Acanthoscelides obtectus]
MDTISHEGTSRFFSSLNVFRQDSRGCNGNKSLTIPF